MRLRTLIMLLLLVSSSNAQERAIVRGLALEVRSDIGPLILRSIEPAHLWISVAWDPKTPVFGRRINGKAPDETLSPSFLAVQLDYIAPRYSCDPAQQAQFKQAFVHGVEKLLERERSFWFEITNRGYAGPGQIGGVFLLDDWSGPTLQSEMIRCGYAVVTSRNSWNMVEKYRDDYRDKLLRLEGEARAYKLGVWSEQ
jgi:hypothetical protein